MTHPRKSFSRKRLSGISVSCFRFKIFSKNETLARNWRLARNRRKAGNGKKLETKKTGNGSLYEWAYKELRRLAGNGS